MLFSILVAYINSTFAFYGLITNYIHFISQTGFEHNFILSATPVFRDWPYLQDICILMLLRFSAGKSQWLSYPAMLGLLAQCNSRITDLITCCVPGFPKDNPTQIKSSTCVFSFGLLLLTTNKIIAFVYFLLHSLGKMLYFIELRDFDYTGFALLTRAITCNSLFQSVLWGTLVQQGLC